MRKRFNHTAPFAVKRAAIRRRAKAYRAICNDAKQIAAALNVVKLFSFACFEPCFFAQRFSSEQIRKHDKRSAPNSRRKHGVPVQEER